MKKVILFTVWLLSGLFANDRDYLKEANVCFDKGDYKCAIQMYNAYREFDGRQNVSAQIQKADDCSKNLMMADEYFNDKEWAKARDRYKMVLDKNPKDPHAQKQYDLCLAKLAPASPAGNNKGVLINGVRWATCNVDNPGAFAATPESAGKFYQWNRRTAWPAIGNVSNWSNMPPAGSRWEKSNDPSPAGWRIPTLDEIKKLLDIDKVSNGLTVINGVSGRNFTDKATGNSIFLPAAGYRSFDDGTLGYVGMDGGYWSSTQYDNDSFYAYYLTFSSVGADWGNSYVRSFGFSVRPVAEN